MMDFPPFSATSPFNNQGSNFSKYPHNFSADDLSKVRQLSHRNLSPNTTRYTQVVNNHARDFRVERGRTHSIQEDRVYNDKLEQDPSCCEKICQLFAGFFDRQGRYGLDSYPYGVIVTPVMMESRK